MTSAEMKSGMAAVAELLHDALGRLADLGAFVGADAVPTLDLAREAAGRFGGPTPGLFNTAGFHQALARHDGRALADVDPVPFLEAEPRIVRLRGGCHGLILPEAFERHAPDAEPRP
jgi:hypothetical protein